MIKSDKSDLINYFVDFGYERYKEMDMEEGKTYLIALNSSSISIQLPVSEGLSKEKFRDKVVMEVSYELDKDKYLKQVKKMTMQGLIYGRTGKGKSVVGNGILDQVEEAEKVFDSWHKEYGNNYPLNQLTEGLKDECGVEGNEGSKKWFETAIDLHDRVKTERKRKLLLL